MEDNYDYSFPMDTVRQSTLAYPVAQDPSLNLNLFGGEEQMAPLPSVVEPEANKYQEQGLEPVHFSDQQLMSHRSHEPSFFDVEFCTPNQRGAVPPKDVPLADLHLPPTMQDFQSTPITTPSAPAPHNPTVTPPVFNSLPAACAPVRTPLHTPAQTPARIPGLMPSTPRMTTASTPSEDRSMLDTPTLATKDIPTQLGEFEISKELQCDLAGGPLRNGRRGKTRHTEEEADQLLERLYKEAENRAEERKVEVRAYLKQELQDKQHTMDSRARSLHRSRREAKVSRVKSDEYSKSLKNIIRYLILNTDTRRSEPCQCRKMCGKRKAPPS